MSNTQSNSVTDHARAAVASNDAALFDLCHMLQTEWAELRRLDSKWADATDDEGYREIEPQHDRVHALIARIENLPAKTFDGLAVKALAVWCCHTGERLIKLDEQQTTDIRLCQSILGDLLRGFGYGRTGEPQLNPGGVEEDPIFASIETHRKRFQEVNAGGIEDDAEVDRLADIESRALEAMISTTPTSLAGVVALTRYCAELIEKNNYSFNVDHPKPHNEYQEHGIDWAHSVYSRVAEAVSAHIPGGRPL